MQEIQLKARPKGAPKESDFALVDWTPPKLAPDEILVEVDCFSLDPYMRGRMDDAKS